MKIIPLTTAVTLTAVSALVFAEESTDSINEIEEVAVTATRLERLTKDIPEAISVIGAERIENSRMFNVADALSGTPGVLLSSKNGGYDARVVIRGAGLKANYGIRELFLMRDGVPITDPDSFTRMDFIDTQDIKRIEVTKGPGNIYATGSAAGVIHLISKSVFDEGYNSISVGLGDDNKQNVHFRYGKVGERHAYAVTGSYRRDDHDWRFFNEFDSKQFSLKYGYQINETDELTLELTYTDVEMDLPSSMNEAQYQEFLKTGKQYDNNSFFKNRGRYSSTWAANAHYVKRLSDSVVFRPRAYITRWEHLHPVVPFIVENDGVEIMGTDLEFVWEQDLGSLVSGLTLRSDEDGGTKRWEYADYVSNWDSRLDPGEGTQSQAKGKQAMAESTKNTVTGLFVQQSINAFDNWIIDLSLRHDEINIDETSQTFSEFNWPYATVFGPPMIPRRAYDPVDERVELDETFSLTSYRLGASYAINEYLSGYSSIARGEQVPYSSELESNPDLQASLTKAVEIGLKGRGETWAFDLALFHMKVEDEVVVSFDENNESYFQNAGKTDKKGFELASRLQAASLFGGDLWAEFNYTYSDFTYEDFTEYYELYGRPMSIVNDGNSLPWVPEHYYTVGLLYEHPAGLNFRIQSDTWGEYYIDSANSEKSEGYDWITSVNVRYEFTEQHSVSLNVANVFDERYASVVSKNAGKSVSYTPGAPRNFLLSYRYRFW